MSRKLISDRPMTPAERQRLSRARRRAAGHMPERLTMARIAENPKAFAACFRGAVGYEATLDLRDALDRAMDQVLDGDDPPPAGYLLRRRP